MKNRLNGFFVALACVVCGVFTASAAGEEEYAVWDGQHPDKYYTNLADAITDVEDGAQLILLKDIPGRDEDYTVTKKINIFLNSRSIGNSDNPAKFVVANEDAALTIQAEGGKTNFCVFGSFAVHNGGTLSLQGGAYRTNGDPIITTINEANVVTSTVKVVGKATLLANSEKVNAAVKLDGNVAFELSGDSQIIGSTSKRLFDYGVVVGENATGTVNVVGATISTVKETIEQKSSTVNVLLNNAQLKSENTVVTIKGVGSSCVITNGTQIASGVTGVRVEGAKLSVFDSSIVGSLMGVLIGTNDLNTAEIRFAGASTVVQGGTSDFGYAITATDVSTNNWQGVIKIDGGTFSRQPKSEYESVVTNNWVTNVNCDVTWESDVKFTVGSKIEIVYHFDTGDFCPETDIVTKSYSLSDGRVDVSRTTPETLGVTNTNGVFEGWYCSNEAATSGVGRVDYVTCSTNLYARWVQAIEICYNSNMNGASAVVTNVYPASSGQVDISNVTPESIGITNECAVFSGWYADSTCTGGVITCVTTSMMVYAKWDSCLMTFHSGTNSCTTNLSQWVQGHSVDLAANGIDAMMFGWMTNGEYSVFVGWSYDPDGIGNLVSTVDIPPANTNLYAVWADEDAVAYTLGQAFSDLLEAIKKALAEEGTNEVVLLKDVVSVSDDNKIEIERNGNECLLNLNGKYIGTNGQEVVVSVSGVEGTNGVLHVFGGGTIYGTIEVGDNANVLLEDIAVNSMSGDPVVSADGRTNYVFTSVNVSFQGAAGGEGLSFVSGDSSGLVALTNVTVGCAAESEKLDCGVWFEGGRMELSGSTVTALKYGIWLGSTNETTTTECVVVDGSSVAAYRGIYAYPSAITIWDSSIVSAPTETGSDPYALCLMNSASTNCFVTMGGTNVITGGEVIYGSSVRGGLMYYEGEWTKSAWIVQITGGTYSHQADQEIVYEWVNTNKCIFEWIDATTFKVTDRAFTFKMQYEDWPDVVTNLYYAKEPITNIVNGVTNFTYGVCVTNIFPWELLGKEKPTNTTFSGWSETASNTTGFVTIVPYGEPKTLYAIWTNAFAITYIENFTDSMKAKGATSMAHSNPTSYLADSVIESFRPATATAGNGHYTSVKWTLDAAGTDQVIALSNLTLYAQSGAKSNPGDFTLYAQWDDNWTEDPAGTLTMLTGVFEEEDDPATEVEWNREDEDSKKKWPMITEGMDSIDYYEGTDTVALPTATDVTWEGHVFSGWEAWQEKERETGESVIEVVGGPYNETITRAEINRLDELGVDSLHAVWDRSPSQQGISSFDELYDDERDDVMTGGDTYVGIITDADGSVLGTITVKCGAPRADGSVHVTATVKMIGEGAVTFEGYGKYNGYSISVDLEHGEHTLSLELDSKSIVSGNYDNYDVQGGVNKFKGSEEDKEEAEAMISHWLGKWMVVFATKNSYTSYQSKEKVSEDDNGAIYEADPDVDGQAFAWGYSYVLMDIKKNGKVALSGKLANGKEVSATATAIVGDNGVCVPAVCAIYSGYDWQKVSSVGLGTIAKMEMLAPGSTTMFMSKSTRGGFGFTAWFSNFETNSVGLADAGHDNDNLIVNGVSDWDSSFSKSMPFVAEVVPTNAQRVADIDLPEELAFCVDVDKNGWLSNFERLGYVDPGYEWIPTNPTNDLGVGYTQYVDIGKKNADTNATTVTSAEGDAPGYTMKARGKAPKMKLVEDQWIVPGKNGSNYSNLKLKYDAKRGIYKGSFKVYSVKVDEDGENPKLKKTKVIVGGAIAQGRGYGFGAVKKAGSQPATLERKEDLVAPVVEKTDKDPEDDDFEDEPVEEEETEQE